MLFCTLLLFLEENTEKAAEHLYVALHLLSKKLKKHSMSSPFFRQKKIIMEATIFFFPLSNPHTSPRELAGTLKIGIKPVKEEKCCFVCCCWVEE